MEQRV